MARPNKKTDDTETDKDLRDLHKSASDFSERSKALELRIKYEAIKARGGASGTPSFFDDEEGDLDGASGTSV